ncbi:hypothetical protein ACFQ2B_20935 [Streptomyces stramineus]
MLLIALVDGLTAYTLLEVWSPEGALRLLDAHLDRLFTGRPPAGSGVPGVPAAGAGEPG